MRSALLVAFLVVFPGSLARFHAADKNGVAPQAISLPSGPGSIQGLGESFQPQLNTGSGGYSVAGAVELPAGKALWVHAPSARVAVLRGSAPSSSGGASAGPCMPGPGSSHSGPRRTSRATRGS